MSGAIFVVGGLDANDQPLQSLEYLDTRTSAWKQLPSLPRARTGVGTAVLKDAIYVCGGFDGKEYMQTVMAYDLRAAAWRQVGSMFERRSGAGAAMVGDHLYCVGGFDGVKMLGTAERFDPIAVPWTGRWEQCTIRLKVME